MGRKLPYDAEIEYLEGDGSAYILTDYVISDLDNDFYIETELSLSTYGFVYGAYNGDASRSYYCNITNTRAFITNGGCANDKSSYADLIPFLSNTPSKYKISILKDNTYSINEYSGSIATTTSKIERYRTLCLFCGIDTNGVGSISNCKIYSFKWVKDNKVVLDLIPVRKGNKGYMYDKVSGKLFGNKGKGEFILGPDIWKGKFVIKGKWTDDSASDTWTCRIDNKVVSLIDFTNPVTKEFEYISNYKPTTLYNFFANNKALEKIDRLQGTERVTSFQFAFSGIASLKSLNMSYTDTTSASDFKYFLYNSTRINEVILGDRFNIEKALTMHGMFQTCQLLSKLDVSTLRTRNCNVFYGTFMNCTTLRELNLNFDFSNATDVTHLFTNCHQLSTLTGSISNLKLSIDLHFSPLTNESAMLLINGLAEVEDSQTITFSKATYATLAQEQIAIAESKNWIVTSA